MPLTSGLYWEAEGATTAPALLLSSGLGGSAHYWAPNIEALRQHYRVITYDHRGTGRSDRALPETVTVSDFAADMLAVLDAVEVGSAHIVGHALGAVAGLTLAARAPDRLGKLVMVNGWAAPDPHFARCFDARLALLRDSGVRAYVKAQPIFLYPADWSSRHTVQLDSEEDGHVAAFPAVATLEARIAALRAFDISLLLDQIAAPTLVLSAADDALVPPSCADVLAERLPNATARRMAWGGHACNVTDPEGFNALVLEYLGS
ncbi:pyrimidine utilization protein D [Sphingomonas bacterium]|uniref:pyrimidine utilization protein D n=1 Tax=Sphingomonas bacterium TaxID=1895847 RepID=UPI0015763BB1|nr:pyrimidine utilization protein D [Sphingomonas bacterium]